MLSSNSVLDELVLSSLRAFHLMKPLFFLLLRDGRLKMGVLKCFSGLKVGAYIWH